MDGESELFQISDSTETEDLETQQKDFIFSKEIVDLELKAMPEMVHILII